MKKRFFLLTAMAAVLFSGCQQQDDFRGTQDESFDIKQMIITAGIEQEKSTRTSTVNDGTGVNILWSDDDSLSVLLNGMQMQTLFTIHTIDEDGLTATFVGNQVVVLGGTTDEDIQTAANVAIYPYTKSPITNCTYNAETGEHSFGMQYPHVQQYAADGSVGNRAFPMVAVSKSYEHYGFGFRPVGSSIIIGLKGAEGTKIKSITLSSSKQKIAGKATVTASNAGTPTIAIDQTEGVNNIVLDCGEEGVALNPETITQFTVTLPPITVAENELTFTICDTEGGSMEYVYEPAFTFVRNTHYTMNKIGTYEATTTTYPVYIGETGYATLAEAVAAAGEGETITLQDDYESAADTEIKIGTGKSIILDLNEKTLSSTNSVKATHTNFILINGGKLEVKNGRVEVKWTGDNMAWDGGSNIFNVTAGGELVMNNVVTEHLGGTDMNFAVHLNNWGEVTLTADNCQFLATYCGVRAFNSGYDNNNIKITNSKLTGATRAFWVHNYFGDFTDARHTEEAVIARLKIDIYNNNNTFEITGEAKSPIRYGFSNPVYFDETGKQVYPVVSHILDEEGNATIYTVEGLNWLAETVNGGDSFSGKSVTLADSIDLTDVEWTCIGTPENPFSGTFDGSNNTIYNLKIIETEAKEDKAYIGFFGYAKNATIKNVTFENVNLNIPCLDIDHSQGHIGAVAGSLEGTSLIENVTVKGDITIEATFDANGASRVAVVAGGNIDGNVTMRNVHVTANEGSYLKANNNVGALAGQLQVKNVFENCSSNINVTGKKFFAGGIIGLAAGNSTFTNCHTTGNITIAAGREGNANDHYRVGGIAGGWADNTTTPCVLTGCTYTGTVSGTNADGSVANPLDYSGYVGRGYTLANREGSTVIIDGVKYIQIGNSAPYGNYNVVITSSNTETLTTAVATPDATVEIAAGTYTFPKSFAKGVTVVCEEGTVFDGGSSAISLDINGATIIGAEFTSSADRVITGIVNGTIKDCTFTGDRALRYCYAGETCVFENCVFDGVVYGAHFDGGENDATFRNCTFSGFNAFGNAITLLTLENCNFKSNGKSDYNGVNLWGNTNLVGTKFYFDGQTANEWISAASADIEISFTNCEIVDSEKSLTDWLDESNDPGTVFTINGDTYTTK